MGNLEGIFRGCFLTHRTKAQKIRGKFRSIFRKKIRGSKKIFRAKFTLQTCHLKFLWGITQLSRDMLQNGVSHKCASVKLSTKGGIASFGGSANVTEKVSRDMGYRSDAIVVSRDMGPLRKRQFV